MTVRRDTSAKKKDEISHIFPCIYLRLCYYIYVDSKKRNKKRGAKR